MKDVTEIRERHASNEPWEVTSTWGHRDRGVLLAAVDERDAEIARLRAALKEAASTRYGGAVARRALDEEGT